MRGAVILRRACCHGEVRLQRAQLAASLFNGGRRGYLVVGRLPPTCLRYAFDVFVPVVSFGHEGHWPPKLRYGPLATWRLPNLPTFVAGQTEKNKIFASVAITTGGILYVLSIVGKVLGLSQIPLMVRPFSGLLRGHE